AASAAATVMTKKTMTCPSSEPRLRATATNARLTAFSMTSIAMKMMITLRRTSTPRTPMPKSTALRPRYQASGVGTRLSLRLLGQGDGADDGDQQEHGRQLERQEVDREQRPRHGHGVPESGREVGRGGRGRAADYDREAGHQRHPAGDGCEDEQRRGHRAPLHLQIE